MGFLTSRTIAPTVTTNDLVHIVITGDTSQGNPSGSSYKATIGQIGLAIGTGDTITISGGTDISVTGSHPNFGISFTGTTTSYKKYVALVTQTGTTAPTVEVLENTLSGTPVWSRSGVGDYFLTLNGEFPLNKVWCVISSPNGASEFTARIYRDNDDRIGVATDDNFVASDDILVVDSVEIRVYL
jgi:hypothetical protein